MRVKVSSIAAQLTVRLLLTPILLASCAATTEPFVQLSGTSGSVSWEIVDVSQTGVAGEEIRWSYTLILRSNGGAITFETLQTGSEGGGEGVHVSPFTERLESHGRLLINGSYTLQRNKMSSELFGNSLTHLEGVRLFHRLTGRDQDARPVRVDVRFTLSAGLGARPPGSASRSRGQPGDSDGESTHAGSTGSTGFAHERIGSEPTLLERALMDDIQDRSLDRHSPLDAALIVSGARDRQELEALRYRFEQSAAPIVARVNGLSTPADRAAALLGALHPARTSQAPLLREYAVNATTLIDVIETGRYNCVSATIVFTLLAARVRLDANPVLVPTHARAAVLIGGRRVPVEATAPYGYDPSEAERRQILRRFRADVDAAPSYAEEQATDVDFLALLGAVYTNASTYRSRDGNVIAAAALAGRADPFVASADRALLNRVRIGLLNELAVDSSNRGNHEDAINALQEARRLVAQEDETAALIDQSLTAVAITWLRETEASADDATILAFPDRLAAGSVAWSESRSYALRLVAYRRTQRGEWELALRELREAATLTRIPESRNEAIGNAARVELAYIDELASRDAERAWLAFQTLQLDESDAELGTARRRVGHRVAVALMQSRMNQQRCEELDAPLTLWREVDAKADPEGAAASCYTNRGIALWEREEIVRAADEFRRAYGLAPREPVMAQNLIAALHRLVSDRVREGRCLDALPLIREGLSLSPNDAWLRQAGATCGLAP